MRIPYSQLRFTKKEEYVWGFGAGRFLERKQEISFIPPIPKEGNKQVSLYPPLVGIKNISPPRRIEINPYIVSSGHFLNYDDEDPFDRKRSAKFNTGADIKIGLVTKDIQIMLEHQLGQLFKLRRRALGPGGILQVVEHQQLRVRCDPVGDGIQVKLKILGAFL